MDLRKSEDRVFLQAPGAGGSSVGNLTFDGTTPVPHGFSIGDAVAIPSSGFDLTSAFKAKITDADPNGPNDIGVIVHVSSPNKYKICFQGVYDLKSTSPFASGGGVGFPWFLTMNAGKLTYVRGTDSDKVPYGGYKDVRPVLIAYPDGRILVYGDNVNRARDSISNLMDVAMSERAPVDKDVLTFNATDNVWQAAPANGAGHAKFSTLSTVGTTSGALADNSATIDGQVFLRKSTGLFWDLVDSSNIKPLGITDASIAAHTITGDKVATASISGAQIAGTTITAANIANATITGTQIAAGTVTNANLANNSITVSPGTGMSGGGTVALGGTITLTNTGLLTALPGTGISLAGGQTFTITNSGVTSIVAGTGITVSSATGAVTINASATTPPDATTSVKGIVQLAGDLAGTAAAPILGNNKATYAKLQQGAAYSLPANATSSTANWADLTAADGTILNRQSTTFAFTATPILGTAASGGGTFTCNFAASKYFKVDSSGIFSLFQSATSQLSVDASTTMLITYANSNTVQIASADFIGTSKAVKFREMDICVSGTAMKILVLASAPY